MISLRIESFFDSADPRSFAQLNPFYLLVISISQLFVRYRAILTQQHLQRRNPQNQEGMLNRQATHVEQLFYTIQSF